MEFSCQKEELLKAISIAGRLAATRSTLPILQNVFIEAQKNKLIIRATDLEQTVEVTLNADIKNLGSLTVPARLINDYLVNNPDQEINIFSDEMNLRINSINHSALIKGITPTDYPSIPELKIKHSITMNLKELKKVLERIVFAAASDETRPILNSVLFNFKKDYLEIVATDGYRLAREVCETTNSLKEDLKIIVPKRAATELLRLSGDHQESIEIGVATNQIYFSYGAVKLFSRLIEGNYPDYISILPRDKSVTLTVSVSSLLQSFRLASLFSRDSAFSTKLEFKESTLKITAISPQFGRSSNELALNKPVNSPLTISVNAQYVIDVLSVLSGDIELSINNPRSPIIFTLPRNKSYIYLVMPLRSE